MIVGFAITSEFAEYLDNNSEKLFGDTETKSNNKTYYPLCMFCYYELPGSRAARYQIKIMNLRITYHELLTTLQAFAWLRIPSLFACAIGESGLPPRPDAHVPCAKFLNLHSQC